ncbi:DMT family transporter [uncultured Aliiroseovarius sp.]|uniref:DMT family transporter n=1 Tax=uncultured Aliiroseovarius sp. TaxID=1658783 RepID=UPI002593481F|nr:DMT family transporter [uncultured Aliiroseovarius sp.]
MTRPTPMMLDLTSLIMLLALAALWGGSFFFAEVALRELSPLTITLHRVFWAAPILFLVVLAKGIRIPTAPGIWGRYLVMGALNNAIPFTLIFWGQTQIASGLASILNAMTAMFGAVVAGVLLKDEPLLPRKIAGAALGVAGVIIIMGPDVVTGFSLTNLAQLSVLSAGLSYAFASVWGRTQLSGQPPLMNALGMVTCSVVLMLPVALAVEGPPSLHLSPTIWAAVLGIAGLSTSLAYVLYFAILVRAGAANLMLVTLLIPPFAIALGVLFLGESLSASAYLGFGVIALGFLVTDGRLFTGRRG